MLPIVIKILLVIHIIVSLLIILLVLMQRPKNEGLGAAFGGGATDQLFGAQTTNVLQLITRWLGGIFFALTLLLSILYVKQGGGRNAVQDKLTAPTVIPAPPVPAPESGLPTLPPGVTPVPGASNPAATPGAVQETPLLDGKEALKLQMTPGKPGEAVSEPVKPGAPAPELEKAPEKPVPAPTKPESAPAPAPVENKPAEPAK